MTEEEFHYERGQWRALNDVLALLNTYEEKLVDKRKLYADILAMSPKRGNDDLPRRGVNDPHY